MTAPTADTAHRILAMPDATFVPTHDYVAADLREFPHLNHRFYQRTAAILSAQGFRALGDIEDRTLRLAFGALLPTVLRVMVSSDNTIMSACYHAAIRQWWLRVVLWCLRKLPGGLVDFETECSDRSFIRTTTAPISALRDPALVQTVPLERGTTPSVALPVHRKRLSAHLENRPGVHAIRCDTLDAIVASQNRQHAIQAAFRGEIGGITADELERLSSLSAEETRRVYEAIQAARWAGHPRRELGVTR